jgi:hypothetical protein
MRTVNRWVIAAAGVFMQRGVKVGSNPPEMAPLTFVEMGLIGLLACSRRFRRDSPTSKT